MDDSTKIDNSFTGPRPSYSKSVQDDQPTNPGILVFSQEEKKVLSEIPDLKIIFNLSQKTAELNKEFFRRELETLDVEWIKSIKTTQKFVSQHSSIHERSKSIL